MFDFMREYYYNVYYALMAANPKKAVEYRLSMFDYNISRYLILIHINKYVDIDYYIRKLNIYISRIERLNRGAAIKISVNQYYKWIWLDYYPKKFDPVRFKYQHGFDEDIDLIKLYNVIDNIMLRVTDDIVNHKFTSISEYLDQDLLK